MLKTPPAVAALVLATALALAGCSGGTTTTSPSSDSSSAPSSAAELPATAPAAGPTIQGTGYSLSLPEGWTEAGSDVQAAGTDIIAVDTADVDGFSDNLNVVLSPAGAITAEVVETQGVSELEAAGATDVTTLDRVSVAGSESAHLTANFSSSGTEYTIDQYYVTVDDQTYVVTFSFSPSVSQADRDELAASVLATWTSA